MATRTPKGTVARPTSTRSVVKKASPVPAAAEIAPETAAPVDPAPAAPAVEPAPVAASVATEAVAAPVEVTPEPVAEAPVAEIAATEAPVATAPVAEAPVAEPVTAAAPVLDVETTVPAVAAPVAADKPAVKRAAPAPQKSAVLPAAAPAAPAPEAVAKSAPAVPVAKNVEQAIAQTKEKVEKMSKQVFATFEDVVGFQKDNVEAFVASSTILTKGFEALSKELVAFTQAQYEQSVSNAKALFAVKSVKELVDLQTEFAKTSFDALVAEATKVSETGIKVANEAAEPITARVNATVEKLSKLKAA